MKTKSPLYLQLFLLLLFVSGCAVVGVSQYAERFGAAQVQERMVATGTAAAEHYRDNVHPIIESRCVSCHACYESPCQLNLNSPAGIDRGFSNVPVYSATRLRASSQTRLFMDAQGTQAWRDRHFKPVLNERIQTPEANRTAGLLYQTLAQKEKYPLPEDAVLSEKEFDFSLNRPSSCPTVEGFSSYAEPKPLAAGMPYGLPGMSEQELAVLKQWIEEGAQMAGALPLADGVRNQVEEWEVFLNADSLKTQLVSRYLYEHLFLASLFFAEQDSDAPPGDVFKLVRSKTPPGEPISVIAGRRPSSAPEVDRVYYRLQRSESGLVSKAYLPYKLNAERLTWLNDLFMTSDYSVAELPGYGHEFINPFVTFQAIPSHARYRFMLADAKYIIEGFIKGPVCRGQVAVDVINDQFWVFFVNPDTEFIPMLDGFLNSQSKNLRLPGSDGSNAGLLSHWTRYSKLNNDYLMTKRARLNELFEGSMNLNEGLVWDGDGDNPNAALTVFRNFDNAAVVQGLVGEMPKTAWIIDYPMLERIHYLLTVDFDVFGNIGHQLNTRLYMDFLRIEGEYNFLLLLPETKRLEIRDHWYRGTSKRVRRYLQSCEAYLHEDPTIRYLTEDPKTELLQRLRARVSPALNESFELDAADVPPSHSGSLRALQQINGNPVNFLAETTSLRVVQKGGTARLYTMFANRGHSNITSLFFEKSNRLPEEDTITVANGIIGDYPNVFMQVAEEELEIFVGQVQALETKQDYFELLSKYGVRRTNPNFWQHSDAVHEDYQKQQPGLASRLDYSRLENR